MTDTYISFALLGHKGARPEATDSSNFYPYSTLYTWFDKDPNDNDVHLHLTNSPCVGGNQQGDDVILTPQEWDNNPEIFTIDPDDALAIYVHFIPRQPGDQTPAVQADSLKQKQLEQTQEAQQKKPGASEADSATAQQQQQPQQQQSAQKKAKPTQKPYQPRSYPQQKQYMNQFSQHADYTRQFSQHMHHFSAASKNPLATIPLATHAPTLTLTSGTPAGRTYISPYPPCVPGAVPHPSLPSHQQQQNQQQQQQPATIPSSSPHHLHHRPTTANPTTTPFPHALPPSIRPSTPITAVLTIRFDPALGSRASAQAFATQHHSLPARAPVEDLLPTLLVMLHCGVSRFWDATRGGGHALAAWADWAALVGDDDAPLLPLTPPAAAPAAGGAAPAAGSSSSDTNNNNSSSNSNSTTGWFVELVAHRDGSRAQDGGGGGASGASVLGRALPIGAFAGQQQPFVDVELVVNRRQTRAAAGTTFVPFPYPLLERRVQAVLAMLRRGDWGGVLAAAAAREG